MYSGSIMTLYIVFIFYTLFAVEVKSSSRVASPCNSDIMPCYNRSTRFMQYYIDNKTLDGTSSELPPGVSPRRIRERTQRTRKRNYTRKQSSRRRLSRKKVHRHSTRVLNLKPAVILLPPFESFAEDKSNKLNPFIINLNTNYSASTPATETPVTQSVPPARTRGTPRTTVPPPARTRGTPRTTVPSPARTHGTPRTTVPPPARTHGTPRTTFPPPKTFFLPPPHQFLLPPLPETVNNDLETPQIENTDKPKVEYGYATTVSYETASTIQNDPTSINPFDNLEKEYNDVLRLTGGNVLEQVVENQSTSNEFVENYSPSTHISSEQPAYDWTSSPSYNQTTSESYYDNLSEEKYEYEQNLANNFDSNRNSYDVLNNTLLAPDVASLGMKIVTSKKGLEMVKEFVGANNTRSYSDAPEYNTNDGNINLETAETGDFRLQAYDNQILSLEDTKEAPKEAYRMLKSSHKPFQICNGSQGYVADPASGCQVFYICLGRGAGEPMMCPNGTLFNQDFLVCDWWYNVECNG